MRARRTRSRALAPIFALAVCTANAQLGSRPSEKDFTQWAAGMYGKHRVADIKRL